MYLHNHGVEFPSKETICSLRAPQQSCDAIMETAQAVMRSWRRLRTAALNDQPSFHEELLAQVAILNRVIQDVSSDLAGVSLQPIGSELWWTVGFAFQAPTGYNVSLTDSEEDRFGEVDPSNQLPGVSSIYAEPAQGEVLTRIVTALDDLSQLHRVESARHQEELEKIRMENTEKRRQLEDVFRFWPMQVKTEWIVWNVWLLTFSRRVEPVRPHLGSPLGREGSLVGELTLGTSYRNRLVHLVDHPLEITLLQRRVVHDQSQPLKLCCVLLPQQG